jgi:type II secretory pathway pseudopilin PulG
VNNTIIKDSKGFTIIEILIAASIATIVIATLFSTFNAFIGTGERIKNQTTQNDYARHLFRRLRLDLESIFIMHPPQYTKPEFNSDPDPYQFIGEKEVGENGFSTLSFTSFAHLGVGMTPKKHLARISYLTKRNEDDTVNLYRSDQLISDIDAFDPCSVPVLCPNIKQFELSYTDKNGERFLYWDSESDEFGYSLPEAIMVKIAIGNGEEENIFRTSIRLISKREALE